MATAMRFGVVGAGFWAPFQIAGWLEVGGVAPVAICNRTRAKAEALAARFGIPRVYDDAEAMLQAERLDFVDIITAVETHAQFVRLAAKHRVPVICQKPMAPDYATAADMVRICREANVPFAIHENWRFQWPIRRLKAVLGRDSIGRVFRARIHYCNSFPVFENQPFLRELEQFILTDMGSHLFDVARFLFGEAKSIYCRTAQVTPGIKGEDVATAMLEMADGITVVVEMSYASRLEHERFPETYVYVEGERGSVELGPDYWIRVTTSEGTHAQRFRPPRYAWADPAYDLVHASIVAANASLLEALRAGRAAETSGEENLKTMELVFKAYASAAQGRVVRIGTDDRCAPPAGTEGET
ncbi:MAG TPA: Gfo/Idh/MocA family oxidoreductase [Limnochordia bacterium]